MNQQMNFAVLWSHFQQATHVEPVRDMLAINRVNFGQQRGTDYVVIAFTATEREADIVATCLQRIRDEGWHAHG